MKKHLLLHLLLILSFALIGCSTFPVAYPESEGKSLIQGQSEGNAKVFVRKIGDGEINFAPRYQLRDYAWISPGIHEVSFMCQISYPWGTKINPATKIVQVEEGYKYLVRYDPEKSTETQAFVTVTAVKE